MDIERLESLHLLERQELPLILGNKRRLQRSLLPDDYVALNVISVWCCPIVIRYANSRLCEKDNANSGEQEGGN